MRYAPWMPLLLACHTAGTLATKKRVVCGDREFKAMRAAGNTYQMLPAGESDAAAEDKWRWEPR